MDRKVTVFERWQPLYAKYAQPTFGGAVLLAARTAILVFFITSGWLAVKGFHPWFVPLLLLFVAIALTYLPKGQWRETYCQFAGNDAYTALVVFCGFVYCAIGFIVFLVVGFLSGGLASAVRPLGIFGFALLVVVVLLPASNYALYNHRANGEADRTLATFFRDLIDSGIHGTHSFARCPSCTTLNILTLGQAHPCVACHSMVDTTMNVRTFNV